MFQHFAQWCAVDLWRERWHQWSGMVWLCEGMRKTSTLHCLSIQSQLCKFCRSPGELGRYCWLRNLYVFLCGRRVPTWRPIEFGRLQRVVWIYSSDQSKHSTAGKPTLSTNCHSNFDISNTLHVVSCLQQHAIRRFFWPTLANILRRQHGHLHRLYRGHGTGLEHDWLHAAM
jgi:hypothetical protein